MSDEEPNHVKQYGPFIARHYDEYLELEKDGDAVQIPSEQVPHVLAKYRNEVLDDE